MLRHHQKQGRSKLCFTTETVEAIASAFERIDTDVAQVKLRLLPDCLAQLNGKAKSAIELCYGKSMSGRIIAQQLEMSESNVYVALHRARHFLRTCIENRLKGSAS